MPSTVDTYYVLREGATQEEQWTWGEIAERCRSGEFGAATRIFLPGDNRWVRAEETDLKSELATPAGPANTGAALRDDERAALTRDYDALVERLDESAAAVEPLVDAACMADDLGDRDAARRHFQRALDAHPFHARVAQEIKRRFSAGESRSFRLLERPAPVWDNLADLVNYALSHGWLYLVYPAALCGALQFVPGGGFVAAELAVLWCYQSLRAAASGHREPPAWNRVWIDPLRRVVLPFGAIAAVSLQWLVVFWCVARVGMLVERKHDVGMISYIGSSPILTVAMALCALGYVPAVLVMIVPSVRATARVLNPWLVVRAMTKMEKEYAMSVLLLVALAAVLGLLGVVVGWIPVAGKLVWAGAIVFAAPMAGLILGRLRARTAHVLD